MLCQAGQAHCAIKYVVHVSVDALHASAVPMWGASEVPNFWRFRTEGSYTDNARTDYARTNTSPNHTTILTGRPVNDTTPGGADGHLWGENVASDPYGAYGVTVHDPHTGDPFNTSYSAPEKTSYSYVHSIFDVVHDAGLRTAFYYGKTRLNLHKESYVTKIDSHVYTHQSQAQDLVNTWLTDMEDNPFRYSFIHFARTDSMGHAHTWDVTPGSQYMNAVKEADAYLGQIFSLIETDSRFAGSTAIILTTDHGGDLGGTTHSTPTDIDNYQIPFYVWGPGVPAGGDLYAMNPQYTNPGTDRPDYTSGAPDFNPVPQPIRNGDSANLALDLLGLSPIPNSTLNADQSFNIPEPGALSLLAFGVVVVMRRRKK